MNITLDLPPVIDEHRFVAIDLEIFTNKGDKHRLHRPSTGRFACLSIALAPDDVYILTSETQVQEALTRLRSCTWVMQNGKFDITHLRRWADIPHRKRYFDTMFCERIMYNGFYNSFSLQDLVRRYLHEEMSKDVRETFSATSQLDREQIEYSAIDASKTLRIAQEQMKVMSRSDFDVWAKIDRPALWAFLDFQGFAIDVDGWLELAQTNKTRQTEIDAQLPFNPRSPKQIKDWAKKHGIKLSATGESYLKSAIEKEDDGSDEAVVLQMILDSRMYGKRSSTYGKKFIDDYVEYDHGIPMIFSNYDVNRAETGRTASSDPNCQNIPARTTKDYRKQFVARPGNQIIVADYSGQEPGITAVVSGDEQLIDWIRHGKKIYIELGRCVFGKSIKKGDSEYDAMKATVLGLTYGMTKYGLSRRLHIDKDDAQGLIDKTLETLPGLDEYMKKQRRNSTMVTTLAGRKVWLNPYSGQCERNALNAPIQGSAADMMKVALSTIHQQWPFDCPFGAVGYIHDELVLDVPKEITEEVKAFVKETMESVATKMVGGVIPFVADVSSGDNWASKG